MCSKSLLYSVQNTPQVLLAGSVVDFGAVVRRAGHAIRTTGDGFALIGSGYYEVSINLTVQPVAATAITATLRENGNEVAGATATATPTAIAADTLLTIPAGVVRVACEGYKTLTVTIDNPATITNATITIVKV